MYTHLRKEDTITRPYGPICGKTDISGSARPPVFTFLIPNIRYENWYIILSNGDVLPTTWYSSGYGLLNKQGTPLSYTRAP